MPSLKNKLLVPDRINNNENTYTNQTAIVLHTKMCKPAVGEKMVIRQSIIDLMESHLELPLTLISANTGCGKSIVTSQWLDQTSHKFGWLSLDEEHNDSNILLAYLVAILKETWPAKSFTLEQLRDIEKLQVSLIVSTFIKDLDEINEPFILVLDDYHIIKERRIHEIIEGVLRYPPDKFHLVILTRNDPPLKLARLRSQFRLHELRMKELAFTLEEALILRTLITSNIPDNYVNMVVHNADGWVIGVAAGLLGLSRGINIEKVTQALINGGSVISDLLDEVVLTGLPELTVKYLAITVLPDRFSEGLVEAMVRAINDKDLSQTRAGEQIRNSRRRNLFLIPLDHTGEWFRYHHFFRNQVLRRLGSYYTPEVLEIIYKAASNWFEELELFEEALTYAIRSKDMDYAVGVFSRFRHSLLNSEQLPRLNRLIHQFPESVRENNLELLINLAMLQHYNANYKAMQQYISRAERRIVAIDRRDDGIIRLIGEYHGVYTYLSFMLGEYDKAIYHGVKCMELLPVQTQNFFREQAVGWYAFALQAVGKAAAGFDRLESEYEALAHSNEYFQMRLLQGKLIFCLFDCNVVRLQQYSSLLVMLSSPIAFPGSWVIGIYGIVYRFYITNHFEDASGFRDELRKYRFACRPIWVMHYYFIECLSCMARGLWEQVESCISECEDYTEQLAIDSFKGIVKAFQVEFHLRRKDLDLAKKHSALADFEQQPATFFYFIPQLTQAKLLFHTQQEEKSQVLLHNLLETGRTTHNKNLLVQGLALQATFYSEKGSIESAINCLKELLLLTQTDGNIRVYLDQGPAMAKLLLEIEKTESNDEQINRLLEAFKKEGKEHLPNKKNKNKPARMVKIGLSARETEIFKLVFQGYKNEEIAAKLFVSLDTVKKHLYRSYQKLNVNNRVSAIHKIQSLGLIGSE